MAQQFSLTGAHIKVYINNKIYPEIQALSFSINYGEEPIYGIDALHPQEIAPTRISVSGTFNMIRTKNSGGLQGVNMRPLFEDAAASNYISIRIEDRSTQEDIAYFPMAKITSEQHSVAAKGKYSITCSFTAQIPYMALDRSDGGFSF